MVVPGRVVSEPLGRADVRAELREFTAASWPCTPLLLVGEQGAGKSTLLAAAVQRCRDSGRRVLATGAAAHESDVPYGGLLDLLDGVLDEVIGELPEVPREVVEGVFLRRRQAEPPGRLALGTGVGLVLRALAAGGPLLLAVDDVQWLDRESRLALGYGLRRIADAPVALLATGQAPAPWCGGESQELPYATLARQLRLPPLGERHFPELLRRNGFELDRNVAEQLCTATGGNPGWALEVAALGQAAAEPLPLPAAAAPALRRRLADLPEPLRAVLDTVATAGSVRREDAVAVLGAEHDDPRRAVDGAVAEGAVTERGCRLHPAHPLLAAAALGELAPGRRRALHRRLLGVVDDAEDRAYHLQRCGGSGADRDTADALMAAAHQARERGATGAAARMAEQALRREPHTESGDRHPRRMVDVAAMQFAIGAFNRVAELLAALDFGALPVELFDRALAMLVDATALTRGSHVAAELTEELCARFAGDELRLAVVRGHGADTDFVPAARARELAEHATERLAGGDVGLLARYRALGTLLELAAHDGAEAGDGVAEQHESLRKRLAEAGIGEPAGLHGAGLANIRENAEHAGAVLRERRRRATARGERYVAALSTVQLCATELARGRYAAATEQLDRLDRGAFGDSEPPMLLATEGCLLIGTGQFARLRALLATESERLHDPDYRAVYVHGLTGIAANRELRWADAVTALTEARRVVPRLGRITPTGRFTVEGELVEALVGVQRVDDARLLAARLAGFAARSRQPGLRGAGLRLRAACAAAAGDLPAAERMLRASAELFTGSPMRVELARSLLELGRVRRRRGGRRHARETLQRARELLVDIGDVPLTRQAEAELARLTPPRRKASLTTAEQRVAELVAGGASNREAATTLHVSVRTVESHVHSVYRKLGVRTRTQLAATFRP